jgi:hypothetical protein
MIFTVVNYLPLLEEEVAHKKIELAKKAVGGEGDTDTDDDSENDDETSFFDHAVIRWQGLPAKDHAYVHGLHFYGCLLDDKSTPPPKI